MFPTSDMFGDANYLPVSLCFALFFSPKKKIEVFKNNKSIFFNFEIVAFPHLQISEITNVSTQNNTTLEPPPAPRYNMVFVSCVKVAQLIG